MLDHLPPLPLRIDYTYAVTGQDELGIYHALQFHDRIRYISLQLPPSILHKCLLLMDKHFSKLEHLSLWFADDEITTLTLPKAFRAPNLRLLAFPSVSPPKRLRFLTSTASLVTLTLWDIRSASYFRPRLLVARLGPLLQLQELTIGFSIPIPRPSAEREMLGEQGAPITLPCLKALQLKGVNAYIESLVAQIRVPLLEKLDITLFNQIAFALPRLFDLINIIARFKLPTATVYFHSDQVAVTTDHDILRSDDPPFLLRVLCKQLDWQIDCAAQICNALTTALSGVEKIRLFYHSLWISTEWEDGEIDSTTWHDLLRPFVGVKELYIAHGLLEELSRALQVDEVGLDPGFLPNLGSIYAADNLFTSFIDTRQVIGRPVQFLKRGSWHGAKRVNRLRPASAAT
jgi:hypothetical protein